MPRGLPLSIAFTAVVVVLPAAFADDPKLLKPIATATDKAPSGSIGSFYIKRDGATVRNAEELVGLTGKAKSAKEPDVQKAMEAELAKLFKVENIDWSKQMVVGVIGEKIESVSVDGKVLTVMYVPFNEPLTRAVPPTPKVLLLIEKFEGEVKFVKKK